MVKQWKSNRSKKRKTSTASEKRLAGCQSALSLLNGIRHVLSLKYKCLLSQEISQ